MHTNQPVVPTQNELLTVDQLAALLQVTRFTIYNLTRQRSRGETPLPYIKCGRALRFRRSSVEQWLAKREVR